MFTEGNPREDKVKVKMYFLSCTAVKSGLCWISLGPSLTASEHNLAYFKFHVSLWRKSNAGEALLRYLMCLREAEIKDCSNTSDSLTCFRLKCLPYGRDVSDSDNQALPCFLKAALILFFTFFMDHVTLHNEEVLVHNAKPKDTCHSILQSPLTLWCLILSIFHHFFMLADPKPDPV